MTINGLPIIERSVVENEGTIFALMTTAAQGEKKLVVSGHTDGFKGRLHTETSTLICPLTPDNAGELRHRLLWLNPVPLGTRTSAGFGDRLGCATVGHLMATNGTGVAPILAQQSVRENARTGRTPQQVLDDAMWGAFEYGWHNPWGADADHLKTLDDIKPFVEAGYTFFTIDPGDHVDDDADTGDLTTIRAKVQSLDWSLLDSSPDDLVARLSGQVTLDDLTLELNEETLLRAAVKYGAAIVHTVNMTARIRALVGDRQFDLEMSVDETGTTTSHVELYVIIHELKRVSPNNFRHEKIELKSTTDLCYDGGHIG